MRTLTLLHRWTGGFVGLILAVLGLSGAILVHKEAWLSVPHAADPVQREPALLAAATSRMLATSGTPRSITFADDRLGVHQLVRGNGAGAYYDQAGTLVTGWDSQWERPELWLFDLHHHLFAGEAGEWIAGIAGFCALFFVVSGVILWWRTRRTFKFRLWPRRMTRTAIVMQHRDLGIVVAPLLFLSALTGTMILFKPFAAAVLAPVTTLTELRASLAPPKIASGPLAARPDWRAMFAAAHVAFPQARPRILILPRKPGDPVALRLRQPSEWLPNGRSFAVFDAATGRLRATRDAAALPLGPRLFNTAFPLHAAKVGGLPWRLLMTVSGLAMALLGGLATWSFWFRAPPKPRPAIAREAVAA